MQHIYFFTGFPGFISNQLIRELIKRDEKVAKIHVLVLPQQLSKAEQEITKMEQEISKRIEFTIISGDITKDNLGILPDIFQSVKAEVTHVFHLAAVYDLAVEEKLAFLINVVGTRNVNKWVRELPSLIRYVYFSTAYVAGKREGRLYEYELVHPAAGFKNHYEHTKYEAEVLVEQLKQEVPVTIIRPGIVKGHSLTGETIKFDGPYFILNFLDRLRFLPYIPYIGGTTSLVNLVPVDYIIQAVAYLSLYKEGSGKTYHLTDPNPYTASEIYEMFTEVLLNKKPKGKIPLGLSKATLAIKPVRKKLGVEKEALDYFTWGGNFDCSQAQRDLEGSGIACPDFKQGIPAMVEFYEKHKHSSEYQINIR